MKNTKGFSLIELMVAVFILSAGIVVVLYMFPLGLQTARSSYMATQATHLGQAKMEDLLSKSYQDIDLGVFTEDYNDISSFESFKRIAEITCFNPSLPDEECIEDSGIKKIEINVSWRSIFGRIQSVTVKSLTTKK